MYLQLQKDNSCPNRRDDYTDEEYPDREVRPIQLFQIQPEDPIYER